MPKMVILAYNQYSFEDKDTKRKIEGIKAEVITNYKENQVDKKGYFPSKIDLSENVLPKLQDLPALYDVDVSIIPAGNRNTKNFIEDVKLIKKIDFFGS